MFEIQSNSIEETLQLGRRVAEGLKGGEVIALTGELGAGKTVFVKGLAKGLGIEETITSPTFVLARTYQGRLLLHHIDLYRLETCNDVDSIGIDDYLGGGGVIAIEWAEKFMGDLPPPFLHIIIEPGEDERRLIQIAAADGAAWEGVYNSLRWRQNGFS